VDRHSPGVRREHKKLLRGFTSVMVGLGELGVSQNDISTIRRIIDPYLTPIAKLLATASEPEKAETEVKSERNSKNLFTVHAGPTTEGTTPAVHTTGASDGRMKDKHSLRRSGKSATEAESSKVRRSTKGKKAS
jgi:hypothetical protein